MSRTRRRIIAFITVLTALTTFWATTPSQAITAGAIRLSGSNRVETAIAASVDAFPDGSAQLVVLSRADTYADALAGVPLAVGGGGPLLLSSSSSLGDNVAQEIRRVLDPTGTVILLGGNAALSESIEREVAELGFPSFRMDGKTRFDTARQLASLIARLGGEPETVFLATGLNFPDALSAGTAAAATNGVVLLTNGSRPSSPTDSFLAAHPDAAVYCLGRPACQAYPSAVPIVGADRYETAMLTAERFFDVPTAVGIASGLKEYDALAGAVHIGGLGPLLLTSERYVPDSTDAYLRDNGATVESAYIYGGEEAIAETTVSAVSATVLAP
jgi:putative cell wall-binding protein